MTRETWTADTDGLDLAAADTAMRLRVTQSAQSKGFDVSNDVASLMGAVNKAAMRTVLQLSAVATTGSYNDLADLPALFSGAYADLTGKPTLFSGAYGDLSGLPTSLAGLGLTDAVADAGYIFGLTFANNAVDAANDIDMSAGACMSRPAGQVITLGALTKRLDAGWAAGSGAGMRNSAVALADTTYHIFAVAKAGGADADVYALGNAQGSTEAAALTALQAEVGGADYVHARRIFSIMRAGGAIRRFKQYGDEVLLEQPTVDYNVQNPGAAAVSVSLNAPAGGFCKAIIDVTLLDLSPSNNTILWFSPLAMPDVDPGIGAGTAQMGIQGAASKASLPDRDTQRLNVATNASAQIRARLNASDTDRYIVIQTSGWIDNRGRFA